MITFENFGSHNNHELLLFTLKNNNGACVELTNYGAALVSVIIPDNEGEMSSVVLGFDEPQGYIDDKCYIGSTTGRFANRIAGARFLLDEREYRLDPNDNGNSNHGGGSGYNYRVFDYAIVDEKLIFKLTSPDGDGGFPGNLELQVIYEWTDDGKLKITYIAVTDKPTIANFTNHAYFNLSGKAESMAGHKLTIYADKILEADGAYIPTGKIIPAGKKKICRRNDK